jgi:hypothetical protein
VRRDYKDQGAIRGHKEILVLLEQML